jgi:hypothetical protein
MKTYLMIVGMLGVLFVGPGVAGAEITGVTIEDFSSPAGANLHPDHLINGNGLDVNGPDTHSDTAANNMWQSDAGAQVDQYVVFDLGDVYEPNAIKVWNFNEAGNAAAGFNFQPYTQASGTKDVLLRGSATLPAGNDWDLMTSLGTYQIEMAPGDDTTAFGTVIIDPNGPLPPVRYILFDVVSSWDDGSGYPWVGLSEVRFLGTLAAFAPPDVNAGADTSCCLTAGSCVVDLDGTVTNPPGAPEPVTTLWTVISGPGAVVFGDDSQVDTTATFTVAGSYVLQLEADNTYVATDTVSIEVYPDCTSPVEITGVTIEDFFDEWAGVAIADNIINGSGLDINGPDTHSSVNNTMWQSDSGAPSEQWLVVDLGAVYDPNAIKVWNFNEQGQAAAGFNFQHYTQASGTKDILLRGSATIPAGNNWTSMTNLGTIQVPMAHGGANGNDTTPFGSTIALSANSIRYLMLDIQSSWDDGSGYPWVGLSEVRFFGTLSAFAPPDVNAGADTSCWLTAGSCVVDLDGTVTNPAGAPAETTLWTAISGPGAVVFGDDSQVDTTATFTVAGSYVLQLEADNTLVATDTVSIEVYANACDAAKAEPGYTLILGDIDEDCFVNLIDFSFMATNWGECNSLDIIECP